MCLIVRMLVDFQRPGEDGVDGGGEPGHTSSENMADALHNVKGEITFNQAADSSSRVSDDVVGNTSDEFY